MSVCAGLASSGCGGSVSPENQIRANFGRLQHAWRDRDAETVCQLLFPFGEHQGPGALATELAKLDSAGERSKYEASITECARSVGRDPRDFTAYEAAFGDATIRTIDIHGKIATAHLGRHKGQVASLRFVDAAGQWRMLIGVQ